jgi:BCD family chlorophyll transporter-like MFS transporter
MMALAGMDGQREGLRMGLWGAAQAIALGVGGFAGTVAIDGMRMVLTDVGQAYAVVFSAEGALFIAAALIGVRIRQLADRRSPARTPGFGEIAMGEVFDGR